VGQDVPPAADRLPEPFKCTGWQSMLQCSMHVVSTMLSSPDRTRVPWAHKFCRLHWPTLPDKSSSITFPPTSRQRSATKRLVPYIRSNFYDDVFVIAVLLVIERGLYSSKPADCNNNLLITRSLILLLTLPVSPFVQALPPNTRIARRVERIPSPAFSDLDPITM